MDYVAVNKVNRCCSTAVVSETGRKISIRSVRLIGVLCLLLAVGLLALGIAGGQTVAIMGIGSALGLGYFGVRLLLLRRGDES